MSQYTTPEIQKVPLDCLLLQMIAMGLPDARKFPFIEPPPADSIENAIISLKQHVRYYFCKQKSNIFSVFHLQWEFIIHFIVINDFSQGTV